MNVKRNKNHTEIKGGDRKTLTPCDHFVEYTVVENFLLFQRTYEPAIHLDGCGIRIANNRFRHSSSSAMRLEGNDFIIEYNEVSQVVNESDDQGGIANGQPLESFCTTEVLTKYGLQPIPLEKIGHKNNRWITE